MSKSDGLSILDNLIAEQMKEAEKKVTRTLTALPAERGADDPLPQTPATFPNDVPTEVVMQKVTELTRIINHLTEARDALQLLVGAPAEIVPVAEAVKAAEKAADAKASKREKVAEAMESGYSPERFRALQEEAQAATFSPQPEPEPIATEVPSGWKCPAHPDATPKDDRSPRGREFRRCTQDGCKQFER